MADKDEKSKKGDSSNADAVGMTASAVVGAAILGPLGAIIGAGLAYVG